MTIEVDTVGETNPKCNEAQHIVPEGNLGFPLERCARVTRTPIKVSRFPVSMTRNGQVRSDVSVARSQASSKPARKTSFNI